MSRRSLFGPLFLIAAGVTWLLISMKIIPPGNLWALVEILPYVLMALGIGLLLRARWEMAGFAISTLVVVGAFLAVLFAGQLGWNRPLPLRIDQAFTGAVPGSGNMKAEPRDVNDFQGISIRYPAEVLIVQGDTESIKIEAEDNLLPQLTTEVRDGVLRIENGEVDWAARVKPSEPVKITINVKDLKEIQFASAGTLQVQQLSTEQLKVVMSGAGDVTLHKLNVKKLDGVLSGAGNIKADGTADDISMIVSGLGNFDAPDLASLRAEIRISGSGSATIRVKDELAATISGAGSVQYYGSPSVDQHISGAGSVRQLGD